MEPSGSTGDEADGRLFEKLRPQERTVAIERLEPGESVTITATRELVRPRRKDRR